MKYKMHKCLILIMTVLLTMSVALTASAAKSSVSFNKSKVTVTEGKTVKLKLTVKGKKTKISWKSSKPKIVSVDKKGYITARKTGKAVIWAKANGKKAKCTVIVKKADYRELYKESLEMRRIPAGNISVTPQYFFVLDLDKKSVPELVVANVSGSYCTYYVYTVKKGKVIFAGACSMKDSQLPAVYYYPKQKALGTSGWLEGSKGSWKSMFSITKDKLKLKRYAYEGKEYRIEPKRTAVSNKKFQEYMEKYFQNCLVYEMHMNIQENRDAFIR